MRAAASMCGFILSRSFSSSSTSRSRSCFLGPCPEGNRLVRFLSMIGFLGVLTVGFIYEWCKGALEWE